MAYDASWRGRAVHLGRYRWLGAVPRLGGGQASRALAEQVTAQARLAVEAADAVLFVVDAAVGMTDADAAVAAVLRRSGKPVVVAANKVDDAPGESAAAALWALGLGEPWPVSALHGRGSGDLLDAVSAALPPRPRPNRWPRRPEPRRVALRRPPQRGQVQPAQQAGGPGPGTGGRGGGHHP